MNTHFKDFKEKVLLSADSILLESFAEFCAVPFAQRTTDQHEAIKIVRDEILKRMNN